MGTIWDDDGLHWRPLWFFPWLERACDITGTHYRRAPLVLEQSDGLHGEVMQTIKLHDGREQVRRADWLEKWERRAEKWWAVLGLNQ